VTKAWQGWGVERPKLQIFTCLPLYSKTFCFSHTRHQNPYNLRLESGLVDAEASPSCRTPGDSSVGQGTSPISLLPPEEGDGRCSLERSEIGWSLGDKSEAMAEISHTFTAQRERDLNPESRSGQALNRYSVGRAAPRATLTSVASISRPTGGWGAGKGLVWSDSSTLFSLILG
jgi:hypothetical protein